MTTLQRSYQGRCSSCLHNATLGEFYDTLRTQVDVGSPFRINFGETTRDAESLVKTREIFLQSDVHHSGATVLQKTYEGEYTPLFNSRGLLREWWLLERGRNPQKKYRTVTVRRLVRKPKPRQLQDAPPSQLLGAH